MYPYAYTPLPFFQAPWSWILFLVMIDILLKGYALWKAGRSNQPYWFIALFIINSLGVLPVIYLIFFQTKRMVKRK